jgi:hypothetical protein
MPQDGRPGRLYSEHVKIVNLDGLDAMSAAFISSERYTGARIH